MRVTLPYEITETILTSSSSAEPHDPAAYVAGTSTTYALGDIVKVVADFAIYESLAAGNVNHTPLTSPTWWRKIGSTEAVWVGGTTSYGLGDTVSANHRVYESLQAANINNAVPVLPDTSNAWWIDVGPTNKWAMFDLARNTQTVSQTALTVVLTPGARLNTIAALGLVGSWLSIKATSPSTTENSGVIWPPAYNAATTYSAQECISVGTTYYRSIVDSNTGNTPSTSPTFWSTTCSDGSTTVTGDMINLTLRQVLDHYMYAFEPFREKPGVVRFGVPPITDAIITLVISANTGTGNVKCGGVVLGTHADIGTIQYSAESDAINFSTVDRDIYGTATLVVRRSVPKTTQELIADKSKTDYIYQVRSLLNAVPALWTGLDDSEDGYFGALLILGIYKRFTINVEHPENTKISLELEEI